MLPRRQRPLRPSTKQKKSRRTAIRMTTPIASRSRRSVNSWTTRRPTTTAQTRLQKTKSRPTSFRDRVRRRWIRSSHSRRPTRWSWRATSSKSPTTATTATTLPMIHLKAVTTTLRPPLRLMTHRKRVTGNFTGTATSHRKKATRPLRKTLRRVFENWNNRNFAAARKKRGAWLNSERARPSTTIPTPTTQRRPTTTNRTHSPTIRRAGPASRPRYRHRRRERSTNRIRPPENLPIPRAPNRNPTMDSAKRPRQRASVFPMKSESNLSVTQRLPTTARSMIPPRTP